MNLWDRLCLLSIKWSHTLSLYYNVTLNKFDKVEPMIKVGHILRKSEVLYEYLSCFGAVLSMALSVYVCNCGHSCLDADHVAKIQHAGSPNMLSDQTIRHQFTYEYCKWSYKFFFNSYNCYLHWSIESFLTLNAGCCWPLMTFFGSPKTYQNEKLIYSRLVISDGICRRYSVLTVYYMVLLYSI